jgi:hypothetical protein
MGSFQQKHPTPAARHGFGDLGYSGDMRRGSRIGSLLLLVWLVIGLVAAVQRGYFSSGDTSCASAATIAVTVIAGPLNYLGVNPQVNCELPQPSQ